MKKMFYSLVIRQTQSNTTLQKHTYFLNPQYCVILFKYLFKRKYVELRPVEGALFYGAPDLKVYQDILTECRGCGNWSSCGQPTGLILCQLCMSDTQGTRHRHRLVPRSEGRSEAGPISVSHTWHSLNYQHNTNTRGEGGGHSKGWHFHPFKVLYNITI